MLFEGEIGLALIVYVLPTLGIPLKEFFEITAGTPRKHGPVGGWTLNSPPTHAPERGKEHKN